MTHSITVIVLTIADGGANTVQLRRTGIDRRGGGVGGVVVAVATEGAVDEHRLDFVAARPGVGAVTDRQTEESAVASEDLITHEGLEAARRRDAVVEGQGDGQRPYVFSQGLGGPGDHLHDDVESGEKLQRGAREEHELLGGLAGDLDLRRGRHTGALDVAVAIVVFFVHGDNLIAVVVHAIAEFSGTRDHVVVLVVAVEARAQRLAIVVLVDIDVHRDVPPGRGIRRRIRRVLNAVTVGVLPVAERLGPRKDRVDAVVAVDHAVA